MSDSPSAAPAPDYTAMAAASEKAAQLGKELGEEQLAQNQKQYEQNQALAAPIIQAQTDLSRQSLAQGNDYYNYMKQNSRPVEQNLMYQSLGLNPDEIAQIEAMRGTEADAAKAAAAPTKGTPTFVDVPTQSIKATYANGAIKGSDLGLKTVQTGLAQPNPNSAIGGILGKGSAPTAAVDPEAYYVKNADGTYKVVQPTYSTVDGTKQVKIPGQTLQAATPMQDNSKSSALITKLAAGANLRAQQEGADTAIADSRKGFTDANNMAIRQGLRYGMSADKIAAAQGNLATQQAEAQAGAASGARDKVKNTLYAKQLDVAGLYRGLPGASQAAYGLTLNAGNSAVNNQNSTSSQYLNGMNAGTGTIMQGQGLNIQGQGNILNSQTSAYNASLSANSGSDGLFGALGSVAGAGIMKYSDENLKKDIKPTSDEASLEAVNNTPINTWQYDQGKLANGDTATHTGPMAQDVNKYMGEDVAPGGKMVDLISMNGISMGAIKALSKKVDKLERKSKGGK